MDDERRDTTSPAEHTPGRARLREVVRSTGWILALGGIFAEVIAAAWVWSIVASFAPASTVTAATWALVVAAGAAVVGTAALVLAALGEWRS